MPINLSRVNKHYFFDIVDSHIIHYPTPISITYAWSFGALAGICLVIQIISGIFLAVHYTPDINMAFSSIEFIMRDVKHGWLIRYIHANGASMFFIAVYSHITRGLYYGSYMEPRERLWCSGVLILILMMGTAFTGYVLPWGQMSFWGATVITSMVTAIPIAGKFIVQWFWGGYTVNNPTLHRFFVIHFVLPFLIAGLSLIHLALLHEHGSSNQIKFRFNYLFNLQKCLAYLSVILEDYKRFKAGFKKKFPKSAKYLLIVKFVTFLVILATLKLDFQTYSSFYFTAILSSLSLVKESITFVTPKFFSKYSFGSFFVIIIYEFVLSVYVTLKADSLIKNIVFQIVKHVVKAAGFSGILSVVYSYAPVGPNIVSNFVHTKSPFGRGYDYEVGSLILKAKGDLVSRALGNEDMITAVQKHTSDSIISIDTLNTIINDPEFIHKIYLSTTFFEKTFLAASFY